MGDSRPREVRGGDKEPGDHSKGSDVDRTFRGSKGIARALRLPDESPEDAMMSSSLSSSPSLPGVVVVVVVVVMQKHTNENKNKGKAK